jgi:hypothetical protein
MVKPKKKKKKKELKPISFQGENARRFEFKGSCEKGKIKQAIEKMNQEMKRKGKVKELMIKRDRTFRKSKRSDYSLQ